MTPLRCRRRYATHGTALAAMPAGDGLITRTWRCADCGGIHADRFKPPSVYDARIWSDGSSRPGRKPKGATAPAADEPDL
jgi:hypothetical protein